MEKGSRRLEVGFRRATEAILTCTRREREKWLEPQRDREKDKSAKQARWGFSRLRVSLEMPARPVSGKPILVVLKLLLGL